jgi:peptidoglycan/xylan/chitin deacetylase (PgdA/CDA1 family)
LVWGVLLVLLLAAWRVLPWPGRGRRGLIAGAVLISLLVTGALLAAIWQLGQSRRFQFLGDLVYRVETDQRMVSLTFDDGPTPEYTDEVLQILRDLGVKATFFVTGAEVEKHMPAAMWLAAAGHELGNHTYSHRRMLAVSQDTIRDEIERTDQLIRATGYGGAIYVRPPYGERLIAFPYYLWQTRRTTIYWDIEPESYPEVAADAERITQHVLERARPGSIILLHVMYASRAETRKALPAIILGLRERGYRLVTLSELLFSR